MHPALRLGGAFVAFVLAFAACTGQPETTAPTQAPTMTTSAPTGAPESAAAASSVPSGSPSATPGSSPPPASVEGTLTLWVDEIRAPTLVGLGAEFEAANNVPVAVHEVGFGEIRNLFRTRAPLEQGPDIIIGAHEWLGQLVANDVVEPLNLGEKAGSIDEVALQAFTYDGVLYGMPYAAEAIALYINHDLVPEAPATWEDLIALATQLQADEDLEQAFVLQAKDAYHSYPILTANGGYIFDRDETGAYDPSSLGLDREGGLAYARMLDEMVKKGLLRPGVNYDRMITLFTAGDSAMFMAGPAALSSLEDSGVNFDVVPIPAGTAPARPFVDVEGFMVSAFSPNKELAQTFLSEFVATDETFAALFDADPRPPTWMPLASTIEDDHVAAFVESASSGDPLPAIPEMAAVWADWTHALDLIFTQAQDAEEAMTDAAESVRAIIAGQ